MTGENDTTPRPPTESGTNSGVSRRQWLRGSAGGAIGASALIGASGTAAADDRPVSAYPDTKPEHVSLTTEDTEFLNRYRPALNLSAVPFSNRPTLYGWKATSRDGDVETDVAVFACEYAVQKDIISLTSHAGDHEWIYVFVDSASGEVTEVSYCAYHWLRGYLQDPAVDGTDGGDHPPFTVAPTYHNYAPLSGNAADNTVLLDVEPLGDYSTRSGALYQWLANGMAEDMEPGAVHDPWQLDSDGPLDAWWARNGSGSINRAIVDAWAFVGFGFGLGIRGSQNADLGDRGT